MKEGVNRKNYGSTVIPKAQGVRKSLFCVSTPKETKDTGICLPDVVCEHFLLKFLPSLSSYVEITWKKKLTQQWIRPFIKKLMVQISFH